jgi:hypothetical protein
MKTLGHISVPPNENRKDTFNAQMVCQRSRGGNSNNYKGFQWLGKMRGETICLAWTTLPLVRKRDREMFRLVRARRLSSFAYSASEGPMDKGGELKLSGPWQLRARRLCR